MQKQIRRSVTALGIVAGLLMVPASAHADLIVSTSTAATLGGLSFGEGDLAAYNPGTDTATLFFDGSLFSLGENIDAVHVLANGNLLLSTQTGATLGGLTFEDGDLIEYDVTNDVSTLFFDEDLFSGAEDINAATLLANGNLVLSTTTAATLGGLSFDEGDLVEYDLGTDIATLFFDGSLFSLGENIDGVHVLADGHIILSTDNDATLGGLTFNEADLIEYDPVGDTATLFFDSALFGSAENIDAQAIFVPEPSLLVLLGAGLALLGARRLG